VIRAGGIQDGMKVLEVATGSGEMFRRLVRANPSGTTIGLDLSPICGPHPTAGAQPVSACARPLSGGRRPAHAVPQ